MEAFQASVAVRDGSYHVGMSPRHAGCVQGLRSRGEGGLTHLQLRCGRSHHLAKQFGKRQLLVLTLLFGSAFFVTFFAYVCGYGSSDHPVGMALSFAPFPGLALFVVSCSSAGLSQRRMVPADVLRIACWSLLGIGFGIVSIGGGYYAVYWPQYSHIALTWGRGLMAGALIVIVASLFIWPRGTVPPPEGRCQTCGYSLERLTAPRCPECGTSFDPSQLEAESSTS